MSPTYWGARTCKTHRSYLFLLSLNFDLPFICLFVKVVKLSFKNVFVHQSCRQIVNRLLVGWWVGFRCGWVKLNVLQKRWLVCRLAALLILRSVGILSTVFLFVCCRLCRPLHLQLTFSGLAKVAIFTTNVDAENQTLISHKCVCGALNRHFYQTRVSSSN